MVECFLSSGKYFCEEVESEVPTPPSCKTTSRPVRSKAYLLRRLICPPGESASMRAVSVLLSSIDSMPVMDICSKEFWRPVLLLDVAVAMRAPSIGEGGILRVESADAHGGGVHLRVVERNAGHGLHELAHVTHGEGAVVVGGDDVLRIHGGATLHDGAGLAFALRGDDHHVQLVRIATRGGVGRHFSSKSSVTTAPATTVATAFDSCRPVYLTTTSDFAGRHTGETEIAAILGVGDDRRAFDTDLGIAHVLAGCGIEDATAHAAGGGAAHMLLGLGRGF